MKRFVFTVFPVLLTFFVFSLYGLNTFQNIGSKRVIGTIPTPGPTPTPTPTPEDEVVDNFTGPGSEETNFLITNEFNFWNPSQGVNSTFWDLNSGSFFFSSGTGWTGDPDSLYNGSDFYSETWNNSNTFRALTDRHDWTDIELSAQVKNMGFSGGVPNQDYYGIFFFVGYLNEQELYYVSFNRSDDNIVIKRKIPPGPDNGGTYYELTAYTPRAVTYESFQNIRISKVATGSTTVTIRLYMENQLVLTGVDNGIVHNGSLKLPITSGGSVGIRSDYHEFFVDDYRIRNLKPFHFSFDEDSGDIVSTVGVLTLADAGTPTYDVATAGAGVAFTPGITCDAAGDRFAIATSAYSAVMGPSDFHFTFWINTTQAGAGTKTLFSTKDPTGGQGYSLGFSGATWGNAELNFKSTDDTEVTGQISNNTVINDGADHKIEFIGTRSGSVELKVDTVSKGTLSIAALNGKSIPAPKAMFCDLSSDVANGKNFVGTFFDALLNLY